MTKLAFVADVHLGNHKRMGGKVRASLNERCRETLAVLAAAVDVAVERECDGLAVLGDLFDTTAPLPQLITETVRALQPFPMRLDLLGGNHEQVSLEPDDNALSPLGLLSHDNVWVTDVDPRVVLFGIQKRSMTKLLLVPHRPGPAAEWLPKVLHEYAGNEDWMKCKHRLLGVHLGIQDDDTAHFLKGAHDSIEASVLADLCKKYSISAAFAGNWHDHRKWHQEWLDQHADSASGERRARKGKGTHTLDIVQCGALVPTGWDNPGVKGYGTVVIWDEGNIEIVELPGPRFVKPASNQEALDAIAEAEAAGCRIYVDDIPDRAVSKAAAREAALAARSADTLDEALSAFVEKMELPDGVERGTVLAKSREYLS